MATNIATRILHSSLGEMRLELFAPEQTGPDVRCTYRITGPRTRKQAHATGVDGFQALQLAMTRIGADLRASEEFAAGTLRWLDMDEPGFPLPDTIADLGWRTHD